MAVTERGRKKKKASTLRKSWILGEHQRSSYGRDGKRDLTAWRESAGIPRHQLAPTTCGTYRTSWCLETNTLFQVNMLNSLQQKWLFFFFSRNRKMLKNWKFVQVVYRSKTVNLRWWPKSLQNKGLKNKYIQKVSSFQFSVCLSTFKNIASIFRLTKLPFYIFRMKLSNMDVQKLSDATINDKRQQKSSLFGGKYLILGTAK